MKDLALKSRELFSVKLDSTVINTINKIYWSVSNLDKYSELTGTTIPKKITKAEVVEDIFELAFKNSDVPLYKLGDKEFSLKDLEAVADNYIELTTKDDKFITKMINIISKDFVPREEPIDINQLRGLISQEVNTFLDDYFDSIQTDALNGKWPEEILDKIISKLVDDEKVKIGDASQSNNFLEDLNI